MNSEIVQKAVQSIVRILKPWELEQVRWTAGDDVIQASERESGNRREGSGKGAVVHWGRAGIQRNGVEAAGCRRGHD